MYQYKVEPVELANWQPAPKTQAAPQQQYTVQGRKASFEEWLIAQALQAAGVTFRFRVIIRTPWRIPGEQFEIDFVVDNKYLIEYDGEYAHKSVRQKAHDAAKDQMLFEYLRRYGFHPVIRLAPMDTPNLAEAQRRVREVLL